MARIWLIRHGSTPWSDAGRHTGRTDIALTPEGVRAAEQLRPAVDALGLERAGLVLCSPLSRARDTAAAAGLQPDEYVDDLLEWDYGAWEGRTTAEIRIELDDPDWVVWDHPIPAGEFRGEQVEDVAARVSRVIEACRPCLERGEDCVLVAHGHVLRILTATWLGLAPDRGRLFALEPARLSALGHEHEQQVIAQWNAPAP